MGIIGLQLEMGIIGLQLEMGIIGLQLEMGIVFFADRTIFFNRQILLKSTLPNNRSGQWEKEQKKMKNEEYFWEETISIFLNVWKKTLFKRAYNCAKIKVFFKTKNNNF